VRARLRVWLSVWLVAAAFVAGTAGARAAGKAVEGAVNLNTAPPEVLALLPGVGPSKAQSIVAYRKRHPFRTVDELVRIKGIGRKMVRAWRAHLAVAGPTTATAATATASFGGTATRLEPPPKPAPPPSTPRPPTCPKACLRPAVRVARRAEPRPTHGACARAP
jgi:competence protein ComEA